MNDTEFWKLVVDGLRIIERRQSSLPAGRKPVKVLVSYRDEGGCTRVWSCGLVEDLENVKAHAALELEAYRKKKRDDATYTLHVEEFDGPVRFQDGALKALGGHEGDDIVELMHGHHCCKRDCWHYSRPAGQK